TYAGRRMRMHNATDVGARRVGACVNPELAVWRALAREQFSIRVENEQRFRVGKSGRASRRKKKRVGARNARADVAEGVREPEALDDAVGQRHLVPQNFSCVQGHGTRYVSRLPSLISCRSPSRY